MGKGKGAVTNMMLVTVAAMTFLAWEPLAMRVWAVQRTNEPMEGELGMTGMKGRAARGT
jgi:hypothetical protein